MRKRALHAEERKPHVFAAIREVERAKLAAAPYRLE
jgi:hypothetical protein